MNIDRLNIILMLLALFLAFFAPFDLVLFSYAFLGPGHYLTEINWLDRKSYFLKDKKDILPLATVTVLFTLYTLLDYSENARVLASQFFLLIVLISLFTTIITSSLIRYILIGVSFLATLHLAGLELVNFIYIFIPTLIHVYIFTGLFIVYGAVRNKSLEGLISVVVFIFCGLFFLFVTPMPWEALSFYSANEYRYFTYLGEDTLKLLGISSSEENTLKVMAFISFAYTYHYLNWFSKTRIIQWHKITYSRAVSILFIYILSIMLYIFDYKLGFLVLLFLSMLHVVLELPLNFITIRSLGVELFKKRI